MFFEGGGINLELKQYLLSVTAAALVCAVLAKLMPKSGAGTAMGKLMLGLFMALTVLSPWTKLQLRQWEDLTDGLYGDAQAAAQDGEQKAGYALASIIKQKCEAYILDKAGVLQLDISVQVLLDEETVPRPSAVIITGQAAPYAKQRLQTLIQEELGIPKENQQWT